jgi:hypothetical protein
MLVVERPSSGKTYNVLSTAAQAGPQLTEHRSVEKKRLSSKCRPAVDSQ